MLETAALFSTADWHGYDDHDRSAARDVPALRRGPGWLRRSAGWWGDVGAEVAACELVVRLCKTFDGYDGVSWFRDASYVVRLVDNLLCDMYSECVELQRHVAAWNVFQEGGQYRYGGPCLARRSRGRSID